MSTHIYIYTYVWIYNETSAGRGLRLAKLSVKIASFKLKWFCSRLEAACPVFQPSQWPVLQESSGTFSMFPLQS